MALTLLVFLCSCAPAIQGRPTAVSKISSTSGARSQRSQTVTGTRSSQEVQVNARREALMRELARIRAEKEQTTTTFLGIRVPKFALSFSQIARGLQKADDPVDKPTRPEPALSFPTLPENTLEVEKAEANETILDERTLMLLAEAERMQSSLTEPLLSDLARGSLSSEAFEQWSKELTLERRYRNIIIGLIIACAVVLAVSGYYLFNYILEELRVSRLPTFGRK